FNQTFVGDVRIHEPFDAHEVSAGCLRDSECLAIRSGQHLNAQHKTGLPLDFARDGSHRCRDLRADTALEIRAVVHVLDPDSGEPCFLVDACFIQRLTNHRLDGMGRGGCARKGAYVDHSYQRAPTAEAFSERRQGICATSRNQGHRLSANVIFNCMIPAFALAIALNVFQPAAPATTPATASVSEATPVAVPPATPTALRYYTSGNRLWVIDQLLSIALLAVILFSGFSATLRTWAQRIGRNWFFTIVVYFALFTIVTSVITLPLTYYEEFVRQHDYGLSNQTLQKWWTDSLISLAVTCVAGGLFLW